MSVLNIMNKKYDVSLRSLKKKEPQTSIDTMNKPNPTIDRHKFTRHLFINTSRNRR